MRKELGTENPLVIGCMAVILRSIFIDDKKGEFTKAQLQFTRDIVRYEQKFFSAPEAKERVLRRPSLGILLYQFNIYKHHKTKQSRAAHEYLTRDIVDRRKGSVAVPKEQVKQEIWEMYDPDFTGIDLSSPQFAGATIPLDLSVRIKKSADYTDDYFSNESYQANCGKGIGSPKTFLARMNELIDLPNYLADIWRFTSDRLVLADTDQEAKEWNITAQEYKQFDIFKVLPNIESLISKFMKEQSEYLAEYLSQFEGPSEIAEIVQGLKNLCRHIPVCSPADRASLRLLIEWEFLRMQTITAFLEDFSSEIGPKLRLYCFTTLTPSVVAKIKSPTKEELEIAWYNENWSSKEIIAKVPEKMLGKNLPKKCDELYSFLSWQQQRGILIDSIINLEKQLNKEKDEKALSYGYKESQILEIQKIIAKKSAEKMLVSPQQLEFLQRQNLLTLMQEGYTRRLSAGVSLASTRTYLEKQLAAVKKDLGELSKIKWPSIKAISPDEAKEFVDQSVNQSSARGSTLPIANESSSPPETSPIADGQFDEKVDRLKPLKAVAVKVEPANPDVKQFGKPGRLSANRLTPFNQMLLLPDNNAGPARPVRLRVIQPAPALAEQLGHQPQTLAHVLPPIPPGTILRPVRGNKAGAHSQESASKTNFGSSGPSGSS